MGNTLGKVIVQRITTTWSKRDRGAAGREHRARLPHAYPLPDSVLISPSSSACHNVDRSEGSAYKERFGVSFDARPTARVGHTGNSAVQLAQTSAGLEVTFDGNATDTGRPVRSPKPTLLLVREQIATVRFNGRFAGHDEAWYEDKIVHVAFDFVPRRDLFLSTPVTFVVDARADLW